jgi:hypothetical protein
MDLLTEKGFFKGLEVGSYAYNERYDKAQERFYVFIYNYSVIQYSQLANKWGRTTTTTTTTKTICTTVCIS